MSSWPCTQLCQPQLSVKLGTPEGRNILFKSQRQMTGLGHVGTVAARHIGELVSGYLTTESIQQVVLGLWEQGSSPGSQIVAPYQKDAADFLTQVPFILL